MGATHRESVQPVEWPPGFYPQLTPAAAKYLWAHRDQAARVVAEALEEAAASESAEPAGERPRSIPRRSLPEALRPFVIHAPPDPGWLNLIQAAQRLDITRPTLNTWIDEKKVIAWEVTSRAWVVPPEQILGPKKVLPGIQRVLEIIPDPRAAWQFLIEESPFIDPDDIQRPIDALKAGKLDVVVAAARAAGEAFT